MEPIPPCWRFGGPGRSRGSAEQPGRRACHCAQAKASETRAQRAEGAGASGARGRRSGSRDNGQRMPADVSAVVRDTRYRYFQQLHITLPMENEEGAEAQIAAEAETAGGVVSDRQILRLQRPNAAWSRGPLRVLAVGVGDYANSRIP